MGRGLLGGPAVRGIKRLSTAFLGWSLADIHRFPGWVVTVGGLVMVGQGVLTLANPPFLLRRLRLGEIKYDKAGYRMNMGRLFRRVQERPAWRFIWGTWCVLFGVWFLAYAR